MARADDVQRLADVLRDGASVPHDVARDYARRIIEGLQRAGA